jgi:UDP-N-acetylglucosamine 2-epimerase (non-hydrolysing)/GDP/UDP-N,N'-diacetylbacillosamine 2-epimerase (hydrolysing)
MRTISVVTVGRSDFGIYLPILHEIRKHPELRLHLIASGGHLSPGAGSTVGELAREGFEPDDRVDMLLAADTPEAIAKSMGLGIIGFADVYRRVRPDILLVLGDRFEMNTAVQAAVPFKIPIAHIHGGEVTIGAIDEAFRHSITKCSHLHFTSTREHANRVIQLGEEPWRVSVSGAPSLDNLRRVALLKTTELETLVGLRFDRQPLLVTFHPVTLQFEDAEYHVRELLAALAEFELPVVITKPNCDTSHYVIIQEMERFAAAHANVALVDSLGTQAYFSLMSQAAAMIGNSSSGIIEAASFELPVVNIGLRQQGRTRSANIIDSGHSSREIREAIRIATTADFRNSLVGIKNSYGCGNAAAHIVGRLSREVLNERLLLKRFYDVHPHSLDEQLRVA